MPADNGRMPAPSRPGAPQGASRAPSRPRRPDDPATRVTRPAHTRPAVAPARPASGPSSGSSTGPGRKAPTNAPVIEPAPVKGSWAAVLSWKSLVLAAVVGLSIALVLPSFRAYLDQRAELAELRAQRDQAQAEVEDLTAQVARWDDPAYIVAQARERLAYVFPGETPYRVVDPELVTSPAPGSAAAMREPDAEEQIAWFDAMWASVKEVGEGPSMTAVPEPEAPAPQPSADGEQLTSVDFGG